MRESMRSIGDIAQRTRETRDIIDYPDGTIAWGELTRVGTYYFRTTKGRDRLLLPLDDHNPWRDRGDQGHRVSNIDLAVLIVNSHRKSDHLSYEEDLRVVKKVLHDAYKSVIEVVTNLGNTVIAVDAEGMALGVEGNTNPQAGFDLADSPAGRALKMQKIASLGGSAKRVNRDIESLRAPEPKLDELYGVNQLVSGAAAQVLYNENRYEDDL